MSFEISRERPDTAEAIALIDELEEHLNSFGYPDESQHGYDVAELVAHGVAFFVLREAGQPVGCGGVQLFGTEYGELKRMYVRPGHRGKGYAKRLLDRLAAHAREHGVSLLRLETGVYQYEAIGLYERWGFARCGPFGEYVEDPNSIYMERRLM